MIRCLVGAECKLADLRALLDTYAIELTHRERVFFRGPVSWIFGYYHPLPLGSLSEKDWFPEINLALKLRMIEYEPVTEEGDPPSLHRWPYWVTEPLTIEFSLNNQWWQFKFTPGKQYSEREDREDPSVPDSTEPRGTTSQS